MAALQVKETASIMKTAVTDGTLLAAQITAGNLLNDRIFKMAVPHLPAGASIFLNNPAGKALIANSFAAGIIHFLPTHEKATQAAELMTQSAMIELVGSLNIEQIVDEFLDGVKLPAALSTKKAEPLDLTGEQD